MVWLPRAEHPNKGLLLKRLAIAPPVLHEVECRVQDRGRIARMRPMLGPDGSGERIRAIEGGLVARRSAHIPFHGPAWIEEQQPSERYPDWSATLWCPSPGVMAGTAPGLV